MSQGLGQKIWMKSQRGHSYFKEIACKVRLKHSCLPHSAQKFQISFQLLILTNVFESIKKGRHQFRKHIMRCRNLNRISKWDIKPQNWLHYLEEIYLKTQNHKRIYYKRQNCNPFWTTASIFEARSVADDALAKPLQCTRNIQFFSHSILTFPFSTCPRIDK